MFRIIITIVCDFKFSNWLLTLHISQDTAAVRICWSHDTNLDFQNVF